MPKTFENIAGIVLCGGGSARMGRDKWSLPFGSETLLQRIVRILSEVVSPVIVVAAESQSIGGLPEGIEVVRDRIPEQGPLAGIQAGLAALSETGMSRIEAAFVSSCDVPLLKPALIAAICNRLGEHEIAVPREGEFHHPLAAVYRLCLAERIDKLLESNRLRPRFLIEESRTCEIPVDELRFSDPRLDSLRNCNTVEEYEAVLELATRTGEIHLNPNDRDQS